MDRDVRVSEGAFCVNRGVAGEVTAAFGAEHDREPPGFFRREAVDDDIFDPIGVVT